jgi:hypothetical protein
MDRQIKVSIKYFMRNARVKVNITGAITANLDLVYVPSSSENTIIYEEYLSEDGESKLSFGREVMRLYMYDWGVVISTRKNECEEYSDQVYIIDIDEYRHNIETQDGKVRMYCTYDLSFMIYGTHEKIHRIMDSGIITDDKLKWFIRYTYKNHFTPNDELKYSDVMSTH